MQHVTHVVYVVLVAVVMDVDNLQPVKNQNLQLHVEVCRCVVIRETVIYVHQHVEQGINQVITVAALHNLHVMIHIAMVDHVVSKGQQLVIE